MNKNYLNYCLLIAIASLNINSIVAQEIDWGSLHKSSSKNYYPNIIGEDANNIYTYAKIKKEHILEKYNKKDKKKEYSTIITPEKIGKNRTYFEKVSFSNGKFIVFNSYYDKKSKESKIFASILNGETGMKVKDNVELFTVPVEKKRRSGDFYVFRSKDHSKILVNHYAYYKKQKRYKDRYKLLDENLNVLNEREDVFDKGERDYATGNYIIDNDGSVYFYKKYSSGKFNIVSYDANKEYEKWEETLALTKHGLKVGGKITDLTFTINEKNNLLVAGYYSEDKKKNSLDGCFSLKIDNQSKEIVLSKLSKFDKKFNDQFLTKRQNKKGKDAKVSNEFKSIEILEKDDGGIVLIGEKYNHNIVYDDDGNIKAEDYLFGDLVVLNLSNDGELLWANRIPKKQVYSYDLFSYPIIFGSWGISLFSYPSRIKEYYSFLSGITDDEIYIMFNDNPKNTLSKSDHDRTKALKKLQKAAVTLFTIDMKTGEKKESLFTGAKDFQVYLKPTVYYQSSQNSDIITFGMKGKKYKYGTLAFDK